MKKQIEHIIKKRNPKFNFDQELDSKAIINFIFIQTSLILRGLQLVLYFRNPKMMLLGKRVSFFNLSKISFGKFLKLGNDVFISALGKKGVQIGNNVGIGAFSRVVVSTSFNHLGEFITIGNNVGIGEFAYLGGAGGIEIGDDCIIGQYFSCHAENHFFSDHSKPIRHQGIIRKGIKIGNNCWIGSKVTILDGVEIGSGCVVAAGAVVHQSFPKNSIIGGVPAKLLKTRI